MCWPSELASYYYLSTASGRKSNLYTEQLHYCEEEPLFLQSSLSPVRTTYLLGSRCNIGKPKTNPLRIGTIVFVLIISVYTYWVRYCLVLVLPERKLDEFAHEKVGQS